MPRPRSLTDTRIAAAALAVIDREGLAALSMRAVAAELGVGTMSLYRYVADRGQLERLVVELVLGDVDLTLPEGAAWTERVALVAGRIRDAVGTHPEVVPLLLAHRQTSKGVMRCAEALLGALAEAGFAGRARAIALRALVSYVAGALQAQHLGALSGAGTVAMTELPRDEFPLLVDAALAARSISADEEFRRGLGVLLRGLEALAPSSS
jgi:AcrR family transcriptional regulator